MDAETTVPGRQYVVGAGGHAFIYPKPGDLIRAYALPVKKN